LDSGLKLFIVTCDKCGGRQVWVPDVTDNDCLGCEAVLIKKTISGEDMKTVKTRYKGRELSYSDYEVYTVFPSDIEMVRDANRTKKIAAFREKMAKKKTSVYTPPRARY
jgi:hypothetical protein